MPAPASARGPAAAALLLVLATASVTPVRAVSAIPDEGATLLGGQRTLSAMVGDVDGDGIRELVRLSPWSVNPGQQAVQVISVADGKVVPRDDALVLRAATPDDTFAGRRPDANNLLPLRTDEPARLIAWHQGGRERVLVASIGVVGLPRPCCLTLWQVTREGDRTGLAFIQDTVSSAASLLAADLDGDGTDELVVVETPDPAVQPFRFERRVMILRWNGDVFDRLYGTAELSAAGGPLLWLGDSDGLPGNEVGFVELPRFDQVTPTLYRIRLGGAGDRAVIIEHGILPADGGVVALDGVRGDRLALVGEDGTSLLSWPAGAPKPLATGFSGRGGAPLGVTGSGLETALLIRRGGAIDVLDASLASRQGVSIGGAAPPYLADGGGWEPYSGPLPGGGPDGTAAYFFAGRLISGQPSDDTRTPAFVFTRYVATLPGMAPLGLFGPDLAWAATAVGSDFQDARSGGAMEVVAGSFASALWVVPADQLVLPELDDGSLQPRLMGAVQDVTRRIPTLLTAGTVTAEVVAPEGSRVRSTATSADGETTSDLAVVPGGGSLLLRLLGSNRDGVSYSVSLRVVTPAGHAYAAGWEVRVRQRPPALSVEAPFAPLGFEVELIGSTDPGSAVTVDGRPASVAPDGTFRASVPAGLVPRSVQLTAVDPLGNAAEASVSVVALLDYRRLPWVGITAALTIGLALYLFLRAPRTRQAARPPDGGTLEELE